LQSVAGASKLTWGSVLAIGAPLPSSFGPLNATGCHCSPSRGEAIPCGFWDDYTADILASDCYFAGV
jgi:hypothetical protein